MEGRESLLSGSFVRGAQNIYLIIIGIGKRFGRWEKADVSGEYRKGEDDFVIAVYSCLYR